MNSGDPSQRMRDPSNGSLNVPSKVSPNHPNGVPPRATMSRAEKFEDEKKRIIESCFSKKDADGSVTESYITHIRIVEDAAYPSSPPPSQSPESNKKPRIIVVAVRKTGRVRMHKARENANGTFSIGKTWNLDDLSGIESFTNAIPVNAEEHQNKQRAGAVGFIVTITKPYYWQATTAKEKEFFIFSLIKIFKKYTGGRVPELTGFDHQELEIFSAAAGSASGAQRPARSESPTVQLGGPAPGVSNVRPPPTQQPSRQTSGPHPQQYAHSIEQPLDRIPPPRSENRPHPPQERSFDRLPQERAMRPTDSEERIAQIPGSFPSSDFVRHLNPQNSQGHLKHQRSESPASQNDSLHRQKSNVEPSATYDTSQNEPQYRVLHSARTGDDRVKQNGNHMYGAQPGIPPRHMQFRTGGPPSSRTSQESLKERGRPSTADSRSGSSLTHNLRTESSTEGSRPPTQDNMQREPSKGQWYPVPESSKANLQPPGFQRAISNEGTNYDESRPSTAGEIRSQDDIPHIISSENINPNVGDAPPVQPAMPTPPETPTEAHRPGLGPMIKTKRSNKEIASTFRKAATAYNAFKPRVGGAADKLREQQQSPTGGPDGITGVVPAPSLLKSTSNEPRSQTPDQQKAVPTFKVESPPAKPMSQEANPPLPPPSPPPSSQETQKLLPEKLSQPEKPPEEPRRKRRSDHSAKYARTLAVDPQLLTGRTFDIESSLNDFGWGEESDQRCTFEELQTTVHKELSRAEAGGWLNAIEQNDNRITALGSMMDRVMTECEELDGLLTLYGVELSTLSEDVAYIEAQSQGLQVQAANQKLLHTELKMLLDTISISASDLRSLKDTSLTKEQGIYAVETTLGQLYTAMMTIDPKARRNATPPQTLDSQNTNRRLSDHLDNAVLSSMRAVRERKDDYGSEIQDFVQRFAHYLSIKFKETETQITDELGNTRNGTIAKNPPKLDYRIRDGPKKDLWAYSPLLLFSREMTPYQWEDILHMYENSAKHPYQEEFKDNVFAWKRIARKPTADEHEVLFTSQEKESEGIVGRKLTVKRSKTVRSDAGTRISSGDKPKDGKIDAYEAFSGALNEMVRVAFVEHNFVAELFHLTSTHNSDFNDAVNAARPYSRTAPDLTEKRLPEADRDLAKRLHGVMEEIYSFWPNDIQNMVDWVVKQDHLQGVGVIAALEAKMSELEDTNQEYLTQTMSKVHERLLLVFNRFIDEQIRGIEDTKVKIKKRKGVIAFMKIFPGFSLAIEAMLPPLTQLPIRTLIDDAYVKINRAMFESLKFIAKESPTTVSGGGDPEDKEALNYHILLIENMNHYVEETYSKDNPVLSEWKVQAQHEMAEHMDLYLAAVLRRPLGKLLDFIESAETQLSLLSASGGESPQVIATRASHSRSVFKKVLSAYDSREIRKGIDALKKRVEKHFGEADDNLAISRGLVATVLRECERGYLGVGERTRGLVRDVYEGMLEVEWRDEDVGGAFRK
ncbi:MAG: hypothetical protein Q9220_004763 [cf. Caloplaca sp. 1 TL-2023]